MNVHVDPYVQRMVRGLARRRQGILALQLFVWLWLALVPFHEAWAPHSQLEVFFGIRTLVFVALIPVAYLLVAPVARFSVELTARHQGVGPAGIAPGLGARWFVFALSDDEPWFAGWMLTAGWFVLPFVLAMRAVLVDGPPEGWGLAAGDLAALALACAVLCGLAWAWPARRIFRAARREAT